MYGKMYYKFQFNVLRNCNVGEMLAALAACMCTTGDVS